MRRLLALVLLLVSTVAVARESDDARDQPALRAEWNASLRVDADGNLLASRRHAALEAACLLPVDPSLRKAGPREPLVPGTRWESLGPRPIRSLAQGSRDWGSVSGRITALGLHPRDASIVLVGSATGGIWKSTDAGASFRPVADDAPSLATSGFAFAPSSPNVVFAATGEQDSAYIEQTTTRSLGLYLGGGLLRSVDAGDSWTRIDRDLPENGILSRVLVHPTNAQIVLAGLYIVADAAAGTYREGGMWRSTDGGVRFARTFQHAVTDLVQDPNDPGTVYAGFGLTRGSSGCNGCGCSTCPLPSGVYRSTDFGATWSPSLVRQGFADQTGPVRVAISGTKPAVLYASVIDDTYKHAAGGGIFRSDDAGATWTRVATHPEMCGSQCHYDHFLAVVPDSPGRAIFGSVDVFGTVDGGQTWTKVVDVYSGRVHPDQHAGAFSPLAPRTFYLGNDGGLYRSTDGGLSYENLTGTLSLSQFTSLALHPTDRDFLMGGTQDNGNVRFQGSLEWTDRTGSDGGFNLVNKGTPSIVLSANYYAYFNYSASSGQAYRDVTPYGLLMSNDGNPLDPMAFYPPAKTAPSAGGTVFFGTNRIWANATFGLTASQWRARSDAKITDSLLTAIEVIGDGNGVLWAGDRLGGVFLSTDGGKTFAARSSGLPRAIVTRLTAITADGRQLYATFGSYSGSPSRHVFRTTDSGQTWTNIGAGLPDVPVLSLAYDPANAADVFVGTDAGVFRSRDGGASWASFNEGLPNVAVMDLAFHAKGDLVAATYGRGVYRIPSTGSASLPPDADFSHAPADPAPGQSVLFTDRSVGVPTTYRWDFGDGGTSTERSPFHVYAAAGTYTVALTAQNGAGATTKTRQVAVTSGVATPVTLQVPVVLDAAGVGGARFTSDLVISSRAPARTRLTLDYRPAPGTPGSGGPRVALALDGGRELRLADVVASLRAAGWALPADGATIVGTLLITFVDVADPSLVFAGSRTSTPNPNAAVGGRFGLFASAVPSSAATADGAVVLGLREDGSFRSNLAVVDVPGGSGPAVLEVQLVDGDTGETAGAPLSITLADGEWRQLSSVLAARGIRNGWARVTKTGGGSDRFLVYGVVNDGSSSGGGTSDGSFVTSEASSGLVPVVLRVRASASVFFTSELVLLNPTAAEVTATLRYTPSASFGGGGMLSATVPVPAGRQLRVADTIVWLRDVLGLPLPAGDLDQAGTLEVSGVSAYVRTSNPNPDASVGGTFGLAYPAVPRERRARTEAFVHGLVQDAATRSNLAIADARVGDARLVTYLIDVFDPVLGDGVTPKTTLTVELAGGQWYQVSRILETAGLTAGSVRVRPRSGESDFVVYGVLNDGATVSERTSDGSYVAMTSAR